MATPSYSQIQSFAAVTEQIKQAAIEEFNALLAIEGGGLAFEDVIRLAAQVADAYAYLGYELGAQWYDLCAELAGVGAEPAELPNRDTRATRRRAEEHAAAAPPEQSASSVFNAFLQNEIEKSIRETGSANLWRDYERGIGGGKWARVPVGETCAWCLMLASQGAWYLSEESALGAEADHYHKDCNCKAVYFADPEAIEGYRGELDKYKSMYYDAENARMANESGKNEYPEELKHRIDLARKIHHQRFEDGKTDKPWTKYNETLIVMRWQNDGLH